MDRILMRHDDVNTFGVVLHVKGNRLFKDDEYAQPVSVEEGRDLLLKTAYICYMNYNGVKGYGKLSSVVLSEFEHEVAYQCIMPGGGSGSGSYYAETSYAKVFDGEPEVNLPN